MEITITRAERTVDDKGNVLGVSFDISAVDGEEQQAKTYWLTPIELENLSKVPVDEIIKRESAAILTLFPVKVAEPVLTTESIPEFINATVDPVTFDITQK